MTGFLAALRLELHTGWHTLGSKLILFLPALLAGLQLLGNSVINAGNQARDGFLGGSFEASLSEHAYGFFVDALSTGLTFLALLLVALGAYSFSHDRDTGAVRHLVIRVSSRPAVLLAKLIYFHLLALLALILLLLVSYLISAWLWEFGPVVEDGFELIGEQEIRQEIALGLRLAIIPLPAAIAFAVLISVVASSATQAVTMAVGVTLALDLFKTVMGDYADFLYARFQPSLVDQSYLADVSRLVRGYSDVLVDERILQLNSWTPWPALLIFLTLALLIVARRKL